MCVAKVTSKRSSLPCYTMDQPDKAGQHVSRSDQEIGYLLRQVQNGTSIRFVRDTQYK